MHEIRVRDVDAATVRYWDEQKAPELLQVMTNGEELEDDVLLLAHDEK